MAARQSGAAFTRAFPHPVLIHWQTVEGDLQFAPPGSFEAVPRAGDTLVHVPRVSPQDRVRDSIRPGRRLVERERYWPVEVVDGRRALTVGRARGQDLRLNDYTVSARHAVIWGVPNTPRAWVEDVGSRNGTNHNGVALVDGFRSELHSGDELILGSFVLLFLHAGDFHRYLLGELG